VLFIKLLSCLRSDIVILDTLIVLLTYLLTFKLLLFLVSYDISEVSALAALTQAMQRKVSMNETNSLLTYQNYITLNFYSAIQLNFRGAEHMCERLAQDRCPVVQLSSQTRDLLIANPAP